MRKTYVNFKNMTYKEISRMASSFNTTRAINSAIHQLNELIEALNILRNMLEGRRVLQLQKDKLNRRGRLKVVSSKKKK